MQNSKQISSVVGALIVGAAAGAALGILFAPHKGSKTRKKLTGKATGLIKNFKSQAENEVKLLKKNAAGIEDKVNKQISKTTKTIDEAKDAVKSVATVAEVLTNKNK